MNRGLAWVSILLTAIGPSFAEDPQPNGSKRESPGAQLIRGVQMTNGSPSLWTLGPTITKPATPTPNSPALEKESSARVADALKKAGLDVTTNIGGYGVVGLLKNGDGPTVLIRTDLDALPIVEETGLPSPARSRSAQPDGSRSGAMHACGHDTQPDDSRRHRPDARVSCRTNGRARFSSSPSPLEETGEARD